jgi:hypothetical protein
MFGPGGLVFVSPNRFFPDLRVVAVLKKPRHPVLLLDLLNGTDQTCFILDLSFAPRLGWG